MSEIRACQSCFMLQAYPMPVCRACHGTDFAVCALPMRAEIYSLTTVSRAPNPAFQAQVPYTVGLLRGPQGGLLLLRVLGEAAIGDGVTVTTDAAGATVALVD